MEGPRYIAVEGPIGVGKTALARIIADRLRARLVLDRVQVNPFLREIHRDSHRTAFQAQLFFLLSRYQQQEEICQEDLFARGGLCTDFIFARDRLFATLHLGRDELALYERVYALLGTRVRHPDLVVYLQASCEVLLARLRRRALEAERAGRAELPLPPASYVAEVSRAYAEFFFRYSAGPLLTVNTSDIDFEKVAADQGDLLAVIARTCSGVHHYVPMGARPG
jgi:deoxyadenosine/deoxycytidine kinase